MNQPIASLTGVTKSYQTDGARVDALRGIDLTLEAGAFVAVMGASGSGKSTLLNVLCGLCSCDSGTVTVDGHDLATLDDNALTRFRRRRMGIVFQAYNLVPVLSARDNVALPLILDGRSQREARAAAAATLERVGLAERADHRPDALSGGEQQRVAIARALVSEPALILADEPTGNLDSVATAHICTLLRDLHAEQGRGLLLISHEPEVACQAERVVVLADGRVAGELSGPALADGATLALHYHQLLAGATA